MSNELDGIPLSEYEIWMIRSDREKIKNAKEREAKQKTCKHSYTRYLGHGHNDEAYECVHCQKVKYV